MKAVVIILFACSIYTLNANGQIGRHELPMDTIPIGGEQQQVQEDKMQGQDDLVVSLILLRDSVNTILASPEGMRYAQDNKSESTLPTLKKSLETIITSLKTTESDEVMMKKGYAIREEIRKTIKRAGVKSNPGSR